MIQSHDYGVEAMLRLGKAQLANSVGKKGHGALYRGPPNFGRKEVPIVADEKR
jgi:hypothetical protein